MCSFSFHSQFDTDALPDDGRAAFGTALRLAAEKGGQVWVAESGEVVAALILTGQLAEMVQAQAERIM